MVSLSLPFEHTHLIRFLVIEPAWIQAEGILQTCRLNKGQPKEPYPASGSSCANQLS